MTDPTTGKSGRTVTLATACVVALLGGGCGLARRPTAAPTPSELAQLERSLAADSSDYDVAMAATAAYLSAGRTDAAGRVVASMRRRFPDLPATDLFDGFVAEAEGDSLRAQMLYVRWLATGRGSFDAAIVGRLAAIEETALRAEVRAAIDGTPAEPNGDDLVLVLPFTTDQATLSDIAPAITELLTADLEAVGLLRVVDRRHVAVAMSEAGITDDQLDDPQVVARLARLLGAGTSVRGKLSFDDLGQLTVTAPVTSVLGTRRVTSVKALPIAYSAEKEIALALYDALGLVLTSRQAQEVFNPPSSTNATSFDRANARRGQSPRPLALVAFGQGLRAEDVGDFEMAIARYELALRIDRDFTMAAERAIRAAAIVAASAPPGQLAWLVAQEEASIHAVDALAASPGARSTTPAGRAALAELFGGQIGSLGTIELILDLGGTP